jgi:bacillithiol biosynthesis cysteine-adding enzyme BshC
VQPDSLTSVSSALRLAVDIRRCPWIRRLAADYAYDYARLAPFFAGNPGDRGAWTDAIARAQAHPRDRQRVANVIEAQQDLRGAPAESKAATRRLAAPGTVAVLTGQQAGLFGGPLFTLLKAMTAVKLAERVTREHGVPAVAIFWVESEDHDWQEVSSCAVLDADLHRRTITLGTPPGAGEGPVSSVRLDPAVMAAVESLRETLPQSEFTEQTIAALADAYRPGAGMSEAFGRWLESLLGRFGLIVYDSSEPATKALAAHIFTRELESPRQTTTLATEQGNALIARGYHAQVVPHQDNVALFKLDGVRQTVHYREGAFVIGDKTRVSEADLVEESRRHPEEFSPNVLLRPIVQDALFPTVCYVAGPNELAYLAQLGPIYEHFGVPEPLMVPRASMTLLDSAGARFLQKYQLTLESLQPDNEATLNHLLEHQLPKSVEDAFEDVSRAVEAGMARLVEAVPSIDPTLGGATRSALGRMQHDLRTLREKIIHAAKRRDDTLRRQFARVRAQAFPDGHPQERMVGFVYFLNRYGPALIDRLHDDLPLEMGSHWVVSL